MNFFNALKKILLFFVCACYLLFCNTAEAAKSEISYLVVNATGVVNAAGVVIAPGVSISFTDSTVYNAQNGNAISTNNPTYDYKNKSFSSGYYYNFISAVSPALTNINDACDSPTSCTDSLSFTLTSNSSSDVCSSESLVTQGTASATVSNQTYSFLLTAVKQSVYSSAYQKNVDTCVMILTTSTTSDTSTW